MNTFTKDQVISYLVDVLGYSIDEAKQFIAEDSWLDYIDSMEALEDYSK